MFLVDALLRFGTVAAWVFHIIFLHGSSGCLGCDKPKLIPVHGSFRGQNNHIRNTSKASFSEDFWTASPSGFESSAIQTYGSISSASALTQGHDSHGASCSNKPSEFINQGLLLWNQSRQTWLEKKNSKRRSRQLLEPKLSWNEIHDSVLGSNKPFPKPIPLSEMVDFLVDIWEQEGLYD